VPIYRAKTVTVRASRDCPEVVSEPQANLTANGAQGGGLPAADSADSRSRLAGVYAPCRATVSMTLAVYADSTSFARLPPANTVEQHSSG